MIQSPAGKAFHWASGFIVFYHR